MRERGRILSLVLALGPGAVLASWPLALFWSAASLQGIFFVGDIWRAYYPFRVAYAEALRAGTLPLWTSKIYGGFPLFAEGQVGSLYPLNLLLYSLLPTHVALNYEIILHFVLAGLGTYLCGRVLGLGRAGAMMAGMAYAGSGFLVARITHPDILAAASWLPILLALAELLARGRRGLLYGSLLSAAWGVQFLAGHPQFYLLNLLAVGAYFVFRLVEQRGQGWVVCGRGALLFGASVVLGLGLASAQLWPTYELTRHSIRASGVDLGLFLSFSLPPTELAALVFPFLRGDPMASLSPAISVEWRGYAGVLPLMTTLALLVGQRERRVLFFAGLAAVGLFMALGQWNGIYPYLIQVPGLNFFRAPSRFLYWYVFATALLFGLGLEALGRRPGPGPPRWAWGLGLLYGVAMAALGLMVLAAAPSVDRLIGLWGWLPWAFLALSAGLLAARGRGWLGPRPFWAAAGGLLAIDLYAFSAVYSLTFNATLPPAEFLARPTIENLLKAEAGPSRVLTVQKILPHWMVMRESFFPNRSLLTDMDSWDGYVSISLRQHAQLDARLAESPRLLNMLNIRYIIIPQLLPDDPETERYNLTDPFRPSLVGRRVPIKPTRAAAIEVESFVSHAPDLPDGALAAELALVDAEGQEQVVYLRLGYETAEWAYDRPDTRGQVRHRQPPIARRVPARLIYPPLEYEGNIYIARLSLARPATIAAVEVRPFHPAAYLHIDRLTLIDEGGQRVVAARAAGGADHTLVYRSQLVAIYRNHDAGPRAFIVHRARLAFSEAEELAMLKDDAFDPAAEVILPAGQVVESVASRAGEGRAQPGEEVEIQAYKPTQVSLQAKLFSPGWLVLADTYYRGWRVWVDGREERLLRANHMLRAVRLEAGAHRIEFQYRPRSLVVGGAVSLGSLLLWGLGLALGLRPLR